MATQVGYPDVAVETLCAQTERGDAAHAAQPGSGPVGATCGGCAWSLQHKDDRGRQCLKCNLTDWDQLEATDIRPEDHACKYFDQRR